MSLRVGVDVGGTNSDAVVSDASEVEGWAKVRTTEDVTTASIGAALENSSAGPGEVVAVMLGTTHSVNACIQARGLSPCEAVQGSSHVSTVSMLSVFGLHCGSSGKVVDMERTTSEGFATGVLTLELDPK